MLPDFLIDFIVLLGSFGLLINGAHYTFTSFFSELQELGVYPLWVICFVD